MDTVQESIAREERMNLAAVYRDWARSLRQQSEQMGARARDLLPDSPAAAEHLFRQSEQLAARARDYFARAELTLHPPALPAPAPVTRAAA
jgi:hypothetical protein